MTTLEPVVVSPAYSECKNTLPYGWAVLREADKLYLAINEDVVLDLRSGVQLENISETLQSQLHSERLSVEYFSAHTFDLGEYCIQRQGEWGYQCIQNGREIWSFRGKAYLYTEICRWRDRVYFGTAGHGGYFYLLEINTGMPLASIKTGGTASIARSGDVCYVARKVQCNRSQLLCVDLWNGKILEELDLEGEVNEYSRLQLLGQQIHVVTFLYEGNRLRRAIWNVVNT